MSDIAERECYDVQANEIEALRAIFGADFEELSRVVWCFVDRIVPLRRHFAAVLH